MEQEKKAAEAAAEKKQEELRADEAAVAAAAEKEQQEATPPPLPSPPLPLLPHASAHTLTGNDDWEWCGRGSNSALHFYTHRHPTL